MEAKIIDPHMDKNFSLQFFNVTDEDRNKVLSVFHRLCRGSSFFQFVQGDSGGWMMIEFWTSDIDRIIMACTFYEQELKIKIEGL